MNLKKIILSSILIVNGICAFSQNVIDKNNQPKENSPLSKYGLGNLSPQYLISNGSLGGLTAAYRDPYTFNPYNPASLSSMRAAAFEIGLFAKNTTISSTSTSVKSWSGNINHIALGFPTYSVINEVLDRKPRVLRWGMGFSLTPFNTVGYNISTIENAPNTDSVRIARFYVGSGGTYRMMWSNGVAYKGLSVGANLGYVFGKMAYERQTIFSSNLIDPYDNSFSETYSMTGITWNLGMQYDITLDPKSKFGDKGGRKHIIIGAFGHPSSNFSTTKNITYLRGISGTTDSSTLAGSYDVVGKGKLPTEYSAGITYEDGMKLKVGVEYNVAKWSEYQNEARPENLKDMSQLALGAEFIVDKSKFKSEEEKIRWRVGYRTGKDPRSVDNQQVKTQLYTAGMSLPMRVGRGSQISYLSIGLEYGKLSTPKLSENYFKITTGFTLNDNTWFLKRKFQ